MNDRDRLRKMLCNVFCCGDDRREVGCPERSHNKCSSIEKLEMCQIHNIADHLLANGVIVPPCKVGDTVWVAVSSLSNNLLELEIAYIGIYANYICACTYGGYTFDTNAIGKTVFLTREEAEAALAVRKEDEGK